MFPAEYKIRDLTIRPAAVLAPMAGVTDTLFRRVIRGLGGCGLLMTEFTSSEGITRSAAKTLRYLYFQEDEHPITAQLFGANPAVMAEAAKMVEDLGYDAVDINLGCPAKKVVKCGGSGLLRDLPLLEDIFKAVRSAVKIPLTIKLRAGWDENSIVAVDVAKMADSIGKMKQFACWFTHGVGNGSELRRIVHAARTPGEVLEGVERFFVGPLTAAEKDDRSAVARNEGRVAAKVEEDPAHGPAREHHRFEATLGT